MGRTRTKQISILFRTHGGAREGAGRKPNGAKAGVSHAPRGQLGGATPLLVTLKLRPDIANLRARARCKHVLEALRRARERLGTRLIEYSVQHDHLHLIVEARNAAALGRAMQGLSVRIARRLNRLLGRRGSVFADRFHHRELTSPRQVRNALAYVLCNARKHRVAPHVSGWLDPLSSAQAFEGWTWAIERTTRSMPLPQTWLLRVGWKRAGLIDPDHTPGALL